MQSNLIPIGQASDHFPNRPSIPTIWRWVLRGTRGARLDTVVVGGRRYTTADAIQRFIEATTANSLPGGTVVTRTSTRRQRDIERAERELSEAGI